MITYVQAYCCMHGLYTKMIKKNVPKRNNNDLICISYTIWYESKLVQKRTFSEENYSRLQGTADVSCSLKQTTEGIWTRLSVFIGSWFHCGIVYGKNECILYVSLEVWVCLYVRGWYFLVLVSETINMSDGTATRWNNTLYIITNLVRSLRSASDGKFIILSITDTLLVLWYLLQMYRAACRWTI
jgi:hypothetical protein